MSFVVSIGLLGNRFAIVGDWFISDWWIGDWRIGDQPIVIWFPKTNHQ
jgi:hypothetical protein